MLTEEQENVLEALMRTVGRTRTRTRTYTLWERCALHPSCSPIAPLTSTSSPLRYPSDAQVPSLRRTDAVRAFLALNLTAFRAARYSTRFQAPLAPSFSSTAFLNSPATVILL